MSSAVQDTGFLWKTRCPTTQQGHTYSHSLLETQLVPTHSGCWPSGPPAGFPGCSLVVPAFHGGPPSLGGLKDLKGIGTRSGLQGVSMVTEMETLERADRFSPVLKRSLLGGLCLTETSTRQ